MTFNDASAIPTCPHFNTCGGCAWLDMPYDRQLKQKQESIESLLSRFQVEYFGRIIPSEKTSYYRNKMEFVCTTPFIDKKYVPEGNSSGKISIGLREKNKFYRVVNVEHCILQSEDTNRILAVARRWLEENNLETYDTRKFTGFLRYLIVREGKNTGQTLVCLVLNTTKYQFEYNHKKTAGKLVKSLLAEIPALKTVVAGFNNTKTDVAKFDDSEVLHGDGTIEETIGNIRYRISADSFFQTNPFTVARMYSAIRDFAATGEGGTCLDVFCGGGGISLFIADLFEKVLGIEQVPSAVADAVHNAALNDITNCEFACDRAEIFLKKLTPSKFYAKLSTVIADPPRAGITKNALNAIIELGAGTVIYVSCNPKTLFADLQSFVKYYRIKNIQPVDMFPHTPHLETVVKLVHI